MAWNFAGPSVINVPPAAASSAPAVGVMTGEDTPGLQSTWASPVRVSGVAMETDAYPFHLYKAGMLEIKHENSNPWTVPVAITVPIP